MLHRPSRITRPISNYYATPQRIRPRQLHPILSPAQPHHFYRSGSFHTSSPTENTSMKVEEGTAKNRRPIAARKLKIFHRITDALITRKVTPNAISLAGMGAGVLSGLALGATPFLTGIGLRVAFGVAAAMIQLRLLANLLDGMVAIGSRRASALGEIYNEVPDRISDPAILIGLGYAAGGNPTLGFLAAGAALFTAYIRVLGKAAGTAYDFCGPMAKQQRMFLATVVTLYAAATPATWQPSWGTTTTWGLPAAALSIIFIGSLVTAARRLWHIGKKLQAPAS